MCSVSKCIFLFGLLNSILTPPVASCWKTSQVTYVTMVPRVGNETLRPLGVATGNASSVTRVWRYICKNTTCWPATAHDVTTGVSPYKCRREHTSSASSSEACVRSMAQSLGDAVSSFPPAGNHGYIRNLRRFPFMGTRTASLGVATGTLYPRRHAEGSAKPIRKKGEH